MIFYRADAGLPDLNSIGAALNISGGWLLAVLGGVLIVYLMLRGRLVSSKTMDTALRVQEVALQRETDSRELWQKAALEQLKINELERDTSHQIITAVQATLKVVTDLQAAREIGGKV